MALQNRDPPALIYLDHSALDAIIKDRYPALRSLLAQERVHVVYSDENLFEISKSIGFEGRFIQVLADLNATHISPKLNDQNRFTDSASLDGRDPVEVYTAYKKAIADAPNGDFGLFAFLQKFYGGHKDKTFADIARQASREVGDLLEELKRDLAASEWSDSFGKDSTQSGIDDLQQLMPDFIGSLGERLDSQTPPANMVNVESRLDVGPKVLQNLKGPRVLEQIWDRVAGTPPTGTMTFERFFGLVGSDGEIRSKFEKINAIYHQLNVLGYYRDKKLPHKLQNSLSDMSHAGMAAFCQVFICFDMRLSKKATAAYECLGVATILIPAFD